MGVVAVPGMEVPLQVFTDPARENALDDRVFAPQSAELSARFTFADAILAQQHAHRGKPPSAETERRDTHAGRAHCITRSDALEHVVRNRLVLDLFARMP